MATHLTCFYKKEEGFLTSLISGYVGSGLNAGAASILIATPAHREAIARALRQAGFPVEPLQQQGRLSFIDARECLARFMVEGKPDAGRFLAVVGKLVRGTAEKHGEVYAYGEMVDLLRESGAMGAAIQLEDLWNGLLVQIPALRLYCAYRLDPFDPSAYGGDIQSICRAHTDLVPAQHPRSFNDAVERALAEVLGTEEACELRKALEQEPLFSTAMPAGAAIMLRLREKLPLAPIKSILARAQAHYHAESLS